MHAIKTKELTTNRSLRGGLARAKTSVAIGTASVTQTLRSLIHFVSSIAVNNFSHFDELSGLSRRFVFLTI